MSNTAQAYNITVGQSETYRKVWTFRDAKHRAVDITDHKFYMCIATKDGEVRIQMTSDNQSGDRIDLEYANVGKWIEIFDPCSLHPGEVYYYELLMEDADEYRRVIRVGEVVVTESLTATALGR